MNQQGADIKNKDAYSCDHQPKLAILRVAGICNAGSACDERDKEDREAGDYAKRSEE